MGTCFSVVMTMSRKFVDASAARSINRPTQAKSGLERATCPLIEVRFPVLAFEGTAPDCVCGQACQHRKLFEDTRIECILCPRTS
jgi:hypothetical protein